jgi:hypothetical protein
MKKIVKNPQKKKERATTKKRKTKGKRQWGCTKKQ